MKIFLDIEATQPEKEIIAIGAVAENGATFYSLVKPQMSIMSSYISNLTHIKQEDLDNASNIDVVMNLFHSWRLRQEKDIIKCQFYSYGDDVQYLKATLPVVRDSSSFYAMSALIAKLEDCSKEIANYFTRSISLIHAFNYIESINEKQNHNPLEDAQMLKKVYDSIQGKEPLKEYPLEPKEDTIYKMPSGEFWCKGIGKKSKTHFFSTCNEAIDWLTTAIIHSNNPIHRENIMARIMKAIRKNETYCNYYWGRTRKE